MTTSELEHKLLEARERVARAIEALKPKHRGGEMEELRAAIDAQLAAERALSLSLGEPTCMPLEWRPIWDVGAPCPHVASSGLRTFLVYLAAESEASSIGTTVRVIDPSAGEREVLALVEFKGCYAHRFGGPNDLLCFHDDTFECLAEGWTVEVVAGTFRQVVGLAVERMFATP